MPQEGNSFTFPDLRGGLNDSDSPSNLPENMVTQASNVEWFYTDVGERRAGCDQLDALSGSGLVGQTAIPFLTQWFPTSDITQPELFAIGGSPGNTGVTGVAARRTGSATGAPQWFPVTVSDPISNALPAIYAIVGQALNGKLFIAYNSIYNSRPILQNTNNHADRMHVWDGQTLRVTGIYQANAPASIFDTGSGSYASVGRIYRQRFITQNSAGAVVRRSEPSTNTFTFTPSGSGAGALITSGSLLSDGETHWELEASTDGVTFYRIVTLPVATTTYTDTNATTAYSSFPLSEAIGAYLLQPAVKFLSCDDDRLILGGHLFDATRKSRVWWSPRLQDPGVGNDERQPIVDTGGTLITTFADVDEYEGGELTGISPPVNGSPYVFKWGGIYKMVRTQDATRAYDILPLSKTTQNSAGHGAVPGSIVQGLDGNGSPCVYFLDPLYGPSQVGPAGVMTINGIWTTFRRVNLKAANIVSRGVFYPFKHQMWWFCAADGADSPTLGIKIQTNELHWDSDRGGLWGGISTFNGTLATATATCLYSEWVSDGGSVNYETRPFVALTGANYGIFRCDVNTTDNGVAYTAQITTRPMMLTGLLDKFGIREVGLLCTAQSGGSLVVKLVRDFGLETSQSKTVSLTPVASETLVISIIDDLVMSEGRAIQIQFGDS